MVLWINTFKYAGSLEGKKTTFGGNDLTKNIDKTNNPITPKKKEIGRFLKSANERNFL